MNIYIYYEKYKYNLCNRCITSNELTSGFIVKFTKP